MDTGKLSGTEEHVKTFLFVALNLFLLVIPARAVASADQASPSAFLPPVGKTVEYRYTDTLTPSKKNQKPMSGTATLTITATSPTEYHARIAVDGKAPSTLTLHLDATGALQPDSGLESVVLLPGKRKKGDEKAQRVAAQALVDRLSLAAQMPAHPEEGASFPIQLDVPGASIPLNPVLYMKTAGPDSFTADANDATSITPPQKKRRHFIGLFGLGILGSVLGGTPGRIVGLSVSAAAAITLIASSHRHAKPIPADISLQVTSVIANDRIQKLSGEQQLVVHAKKGPYTLGDAWSFVAL